MQHSNNPYPIERIISSGSYLTAGWLGAIWLIIAALAKKRVTPFIMYHTFQSIFLAILYFLLDFLMHCIGSIIGFIPVIRNIPVYANWPLAFAFNLSFVQLFTTSVLLYLIITSFLGYYSYIPWVSDIIKNNTNR